MSANFGGRDVTRWLMGPGRLDHVSSRVGRVFTSRRKNSCPTVRTCCSMLSSRRIASFERFYRLVDFRRVARERSSRRRRRKRRRSQNRSTLLANVVCEGGVCRTGGVDMFRRRLLRDIESVAGSIVVDGPVLDVERKDGGAVLKGGQLLATLHYGRHYPARWEEYGSSVVRRRFWYSLFFALCVCVYALPLEFTRANKISCCTDNPDVVLFPFSQNLVNVEDFLSFLRFYLRTNRFATFLSLSLSLSLSWPTNTHKSLSLFVSFDTKNIRNVSFYVHYMYKDERRIVVLLLRSFLSSLAVLGTTDGDRCAAIDAHERIGVGCEYDDVLNCTSNGCCWDDNYDNVTYPSQCGADTVFVDCWGNYNQNDCEAFGCCWNTTNNNHCHLATYHKANQFHDAFMGNRRKRPVSYH